MGQSQSLLEKMRAGSDSTFMQVLIALVMLSFLGWTRGGKGDRSHTIATVNGAQILDVEYGRAIRQAVAYQESRMNRTLSDEEQKQVGEQVKQQLIEDEVLVQKARDLGLEVSDTEVARTLLDIKGLRGEDGKFSQDLYEKFLKRQGMTDAGFEEKLRENLLREKLRTLVLIGANVGEPAIRAAWIAANTKYDIEYVRVRPGLFDDDVQTTPEELASWEKENEEQIQQAYDRDLQRLYNHPETVHPRMIRLAVRDDGVTAAELAARLEAIGRELDGGADFEALAKRWSEDPSANAGGDLGDRPVTALPPEVADAVKGLESGQRSQVVTSEKDVRLYRLESRTAARVDDLASVRDGIAKRLIAEERTPTMAADYAAQLLSKWKESGAPPQDLLDAQQLVATKTGPITADSAGSGPFSPPEKLLGDAARGKPGDVLPEVYESNGVLWVGRLAERADADPAEYEAKKEEIRDQFLERARIDFYQGWVAAQKAEAKIQ